MILLGIDIVERFKKKHPTSRKSLDRWIQMIEQGAFESPQDFKNLFGANVDFMGTLTVFDVGGNKVRAITRVWFGKKVIKVTDVLTHNEYDKNKWKD